MAAASSSSRFTFSTLVRASESRGLDAAGDVGLYAAIFADIRPTDYSCRQYRAGGSPGYFDLYLRARLEVEDLQIINRRSSLRHAKTALTPSKLARALLRPR